jgi:hypothetical protein
MDPVHAPVIPALATEVAYTRTVVKAAEMGHWLVHHCRPAPSAKGWRTPIQGHKGFPDIFAVHPSGRCMAIELKRRPNKPSPEQSSWLLVLRLAGIDSRVVYVPEELDALVAELIQS